MHNKSTLTTILGAEHMIA